MPNPVRGFLAAGAAIIISLTAIPIFAQTGAGLLEGTAAFGDWHTDRPGTRRLIRPQDLPAPIWPSQYGIQSEQCAEPTIRSQSSQMALKSTCLPQA